MALHQIDEGALALVRRSVHVNIEKRLLSQKLLLNGVRERPIGPAHHRHHAGTPGLGVLDEMVCKLLVPRVVREADDVR